VVGDVNVVQEVTGQGTSKAEQVGEETENPHAVALGRLGGLKGGKARSKKLTPEQRKEIARKAAVARWEKSHT
jgi:hypothetical protein